MKCWVSMGQVEASGSNPCSVCMKGVGRNSILDMELVVSCWGHERCSTSQEI